MNTPRIVVFCRYPDAGRCKTRLIPTLGSEGAARLHKTLAEQTINAARASGLPAELHFTGANETEFAAWLGDDLKLVPQCEGDLGQRLLNAAQPYPVIFIGSDCPDLTAKHLQQAAEKLATARAVMGPAEDGGYWLLGLSEPCHTAFEEINWGTETVYNETHERLSSEGFDPAILETLADCDRPEDLERWPELTA